MIVLKKTRGGKITSDHQYMTGTTQSDQTQSSDEVGNQETENHKGPNILFLCDVCKAVFNNIIALRVGRAFFYLHDWIHL